MKEDLKKTISAYKAPFGDFEVITVPKLNYLMIDGRGDPNISEQFKGAIEALYPVAYKIKFASKQQLGKDYIVMPLEGLWWSDDMASFTTARDKSNWDWTLMIMQPDWITQQMVTEAIEKVAQKSKPKYLDKVRFETLDEGRVVQTLHKGSFDDEAAILEQMHTQFIPNNGLSMRGKHHEIYFSDFRKVAPKKMKTILRQPIF